MSMEGVSLLFVPADRPDRYATAAASGADAIIVDLEDAVSPDAKQSAREALCRRGALPQGIPTFVRVNGRATRWHADDVRAVSTLAVAGVFLPKAEGATELLALSTDLPRVSIVAMIESARGLAAVREIAGVEAVARVAFGSYDFCADIGALHTRDALLAARSEIVLASRIHHLPPPIDGVSTSIDDAKAVEDDARYARALGFGGKLCIHPRQIPAVRHGFAPSTPELAWARRILAAEDEGAVSVDGELVDAPIRARARQLLSGAGRRRATMKAAASATHTES